MNALLLSIAMGFASPARAGVVAAPRLTGSLAPGGVPAIAAGVSAPALSPAALSAPLSLSAPVISDAPRLMLPTAIPALPAPPVIAASGLASVAGPSAKAEARSKSLDDSAAEAKALFDGGRAAAPGEGWTLGSFEGDGGAPIHYKSREGTGGTPSRVYAGGLALTESFEPLFARAQKPAGDELFVWTRGHAPSAWLMTKSPLDADARDLARAVLIAAKNSPGGKVELALHSFGTLVFQRMTQLHAEPAVAAALKALSGSSVFLLHATTHFEGSEKKAGPDFERMGQATRAVVDWLNAGDATADLWEQTARMNPFLGPAIAAWLETWRFQRGQVIALAAKDAAGMMLADLKDPWDKAYDHIRKAFIKDLKNDAKDAGWQEAMLRRSSDMFRLEFSPEDAARIRTLGIRLELIHADDDKLLNWESAKVLFERLGIEAPEKAPPSGTVLTDKTGRFRARIVAGDHYWPLKKRDELAKILKP
ncbi:MAG: hypothetical protein HYV14_04340 [Elusimicrobia bacterium]|nr:hypothetical protein [Elusimicrobiota bacterium]